MAFVFRKMTPKGAFIAGVFSLVLALLFAVYTTYLVFRNDDRKNNCTEKTEAVIVDIVERREPGRNGRIKYHPVVVYKVGKKQYKRELDVGDENPDDREIGETIEMLYDPDDPQKSCTEAEKKKDRRWVLMMAFYTVIALGGSAYYLYKSRKMKTD
jgi:hypothetical protein